MRFPRCSRRTTVGPDDVNNSIANRNGSQDAAASPGRDATDDDEFLSQVEGVQATRCTGVGPSAPATADEAGQHAARYLAEGRWEQALDAFSAALAVCPERALQGELLLGRAATYCGFSSHLRGIPAADSESHARYAPDPTHLAARALRDAESALHLQAANIARLHAARGAALFLLERYSEAWDAYRLAHQHAPSSHLAQRLAECERARAPLHDAAVITLRPPSAAPSLPQDRVAVGSQALEDAECILCLKLLYEPVTTPCGHTFCRSCFARAADHTNKCPMCRTVVHVARELPVTIALKNLLERSFPREYAARREEEDAVAVAAASAADQGPLPLFVMSVLMPGERMALNIFEPRYRLMVRRVMEGSRRFGMATIDRGHQLCDVACESEITECEPLPDGRFYIEIVGKRRFTTGSTTEQDGYRVAVPQFITDIAVEAGSTEATELQAIIIEVESLAERWVDRLRGLGQSRQAVAELVRRVGNRPPASDPEKLSFWVANLVCPVLDERTVKLQMLRTTCTLERMRLLRHVLVQLQDVQMSGCSIM